MEASQETEAEIPAAAKRKWIKRNKIIVMSSITISSLVMLMAIWAVMSLSVNNSCACASIITLIRGSDANNWTFTIDGLSSTDGHNFSSTPTSEFKVSLTNGTGIGIIIEESLTIASGTHGFKYISASSLNHLSAGDIFSLNRTTYITGSTFAIISPDGIETYASYTV